MTANDFVTMEELHVIRRHASRERTEYLVRLAKALLAMLRAVLTGKAPGGFYAAQ